VLPPPSPGQIRPSPAIGGHLICSSLAASLEGPHLRVAPICASSSVPISPIRQNCPRSAPVDGRARLRPQGAVQRAEAILSMQPALLLPLIAAAQGLRAWIEGGETRPTPVRSLTQIGR